MQLAPLVPQPTTPQAVLDSHHLEPHPAAQHGTHPGPTPAPPPFYLRRFGIGSIDFWSLDVEGAELEVLKTADFSRLSVKVLMVELDGHNPEKDQAVTDLLAGAGFTPLKKTVKVGGQRVCGFRSFPDQLFFTGQLSFVSFGISCQTIPLLFFPRPACRMTCQN